MNPEPQAPAPNPIEPSPINPANHKSAMIDLQIFDDSMSKVLKDLETLEQARSIPKEIKEEKEPKETKETKEPKELKEPKEPKESKESKDSKGESVQSTPSRKDIAVVMHIPKKQVGYSWQYFAKGVQEVNYLEEFFRSNKFEAVDLNHIGLKDDGKDEDPQFSTEEMAKRAEDFLKKGTAMNNRFEDTIASIERRYMKNNGFIRSDSLEEEDDELKSFIDDVEYTKKKNNAKKGAKDLNKYIRVKVEDFVFFNGDLSEFTKSSLYKNRKKEIELSLAQTTVEPIKKGGGSGKNRDRDPSNPPKKKVNKDSKKDSREGDDKEKKKEKKDSKETKEIKDSKDKEEMPAPKAKDPSKKARKRKEPETDGEEKEKKEKKTEKGEKGEKDKGEKGEKKLKKTKQNDAEKDAKASENKTITPMNTQEPPKLAAPTLSQLPVVLALPPSQPKVPLDVIEIQ